MTTTVTIRAGVGVAPTPARTFYELGERVVIRRALTDTDLAHVRARIIGWATRSGQLLYLVTFPKTQGRVWIDEHAVVRSDQGRTP